MSFDEAFSSGTSNLINIQNISITPANSLMSLSHQSLLPPAQRQCYNIFHHRLVLSILEFHIHEIIYILRHFDSEKKPRKKILTPHHQKRQGKFYQDGRDLFILFMGSEKRICVEKDLENLTKGIRCDFRRVETYLF